MIYFVIFPSNLNLQICVMEIINKVFLSSFIGTFIQRLETAYGLLIKQQYTIEAMYRLGYITKTLKVKWRTVMYTHACLPIISEVCYHACLFIILEVDFLTCISMYQYP